MRRVSISIAIVILSACAHQPRPAADPPAGAAIPAPGIPGTASPVATNAPTTALPPNLSNADLRRQGYRPTLRRGQLVYCRAEQVTGSRFRNQVCRSEQEIKDDAQRARDQLTVPRQSQCVGPCG